MSSQFLNHLITEEISPEKFRLLEPLEYISSSLKRKIIVPAGFETNFMSVPRWPLIYAWLGDKYRRAGALHDFLYQSRLVSRWSADMELIEAMGSLGANDAEIIACWLAVRIKGGDRYGKND